LDRFLSGLQARGLFDKTLFLISGDHGEGFGRHEGNYGHTLFIYDENIHVPYFIVVPGLIGEPIRVNRAASLVDTAPTILDLLGLPIPQEYQGSSLLDSTSRMALFYTDYSLGLLGLRDGRWKFVYELGSGRGKLFDLATDPDEEKNLAIQEPERVKAYRVHLKNWAAAQRALILHPPMTRAKTTSDVEAHQPSPRPSPIGWERENRPPSVGVSSHFGDCERPVLLFPLPSDGRGSG
jgi:arylsulfatase A-like enzyme